MLSKSCFINLSKVNTGHTLVHFFSLVEASLVRSESFDLALSISALWFGGEVDSTPLSLAVSITVFICVLVFFLVLQGLSSNILAFWGNLEDSAPFVGVPLQLFVSDVFSEEAPKLSANLMTNSAQSGEFIRPILSSVSAIVPGLLSM